jgi:hypothetical protein
VLVLLAGLLAVGVLVDRADERERAPVDAADDLERAFGTPLGGTGGATASAWYCAGGTAEDGGLADHSVVVANPTDREATGVITVFPGRLQPRPPGAADDAAPGASSTTTSTTAAPPSTTTTTTPPPEPVSREFTLAPTSRAAFVLRDILPSPYASALVEASGTTVTVEHQVTGELGHTAAPCASSPASTWHFAWGVTRRDAREILTFFNPFPDDATVDVRFATEQGEREPVRFRGFIVPGRSVVAVNIGDDVTRREQVSTTIEVRSGRIVVDRIQTFDGSVGPKGITLTLGTPSAAETWVYPEGYVRDGVAQQYVVYNAGDRPAEVEVELRLQAQGDDIPPEPFSLTVPDGGYQLVSLGDDERVPRDVAFFGIVRSLNGVPVVAERVLLSGEPAARSGVSTVPGSPIGSRAWVLAVGAADDRTDEWLSIVNLSNDDAAVVSVTALAGQPVAVEGLSDLTVPPGNRVAIRVGEHIERGELALLLRADRPIVVERSLYRVGALGMSSALGIPLRDGLYIPPPLDG